MYRKRNIKLYVQMLEKEERKNRKLKKTLRSGLVNKWERKVSE